MGQKSNTIFREYADFSRIAGFRRISQILGGNLFEKKAASAVAGEAALYGFHYFSNFCEIFNL